MSPTKRPSAVSGLRRGLDAVEHAPLSPEDAALVEGSTPAQQRVREALRASGPEKPARITLNLPPSLMRDVERWALDAAETLVMPRVSTQDALRAMIRACLTDSEARSAALARIRPDDSA